VNFLPWTGPVIRAAAALHVSTTDIFNPLIPSNSSAGRFLRYRLLARQSREEKRLG